MALKKRKTLSCESVFVGIKLAQLYRFAGSSVAFAIIEEAKAKILYNATLTQCSSAG